jgi:hypothetical protein
MGIACRISLCCLLICSCEARKSPSSHQPASPQTSQLNLGQTVSLSLTPLQEFDFKSKKEILQARTLEVLRYPELIKGTYSPSEDIFGQIQDGKPWWGIEGLYLHGGTERSIEGLSKESRFLTNPYLLVGLAETHGWQETGSTQTPLYPSPLEIRYSDAEVMIKYDVENHFAYKLRVNAIDANDRILNLIAYNARDFGFHFLYLDPGQSKNVGTVEPRERAVNIVQYIHCGGSCGYPGGCNNMSPLQSELNIRVGPVPARAYIKLWKKDPGDINSPADLPVILELN